MNRFTLSVLAPVVFFVGHLLADNKAKLIDQDMKALQGIWLVETAYQDGKQVPEKNRQNEEYCLYAVKVTDDKFQFALLPNKTEYGKSATFTLDPIATPKILDFGNQNRREGVAYAIDGDTLTVCYRIDPGFGLGRFPKKLETKSGDKLYILVLKRSKEK